MSVPTPMRLAPNEISADSPPDEPPDVSFRLRGFTVRPKTLLTVSAIIIAVGTLVFTYSTAPPCRRRSVRVLLYVAGSLTSDVKPTVESLPMMLKLSLREIGRPWNGPFGLPVLRRWSSNSLARAMASSKRISERQFV